MVVYPTKLLFDKGNLVINGKVPGRVEHDKHVSHVYISEDGREKKGIDRQISKSILTGDPKMSLVHGNNDGNFPVLGFDLMPSLNEGDERCSLSDLLTWRDDALTDSEIWAVCRECCLALTSVQHSPDMFQALCITPDTLAFDANGAICLLDFSDHEGNLVYLAPEFDSLGNSFKVKFNLISFINSSIALVTSKR
ncbi:hypothetical protein CAPTEDRAFT_189348 [Capitella teleta]|uniref:KIND domain-containing protein n=1 Tax=Capitella teleta TaxID=283909 RepID=R7T3A0_CAPTE|nr:hypothetical protein CAPTEDRAFT_189348 [Capitella teleta]|eukprot:ELT87103.1 hypothetical protein CAPTEDRAFT_189348 [Capitella teleta]